MRNYRKHSTWSETRKGWLHIGTDREGRRSIVCHFGIDSFNEDSDRIIEFARTNRLVITSTFLSIAKAQSVRVIDGMRACVYIRINI